MSLTLLHQEQVFIQNIEKQTKTTQEKRKTTQSSLAIFYQNEKFHKTLQNHITHYQLTKNLCYHKPTGILIFACYDQISFYNIAEYSLMTKQLQNSSFCGVSTNDEMLLLAGLTSNVTLINLRNEKVEQCILVPESDVIINQADFISDTEIIVSDNFQQIRIFDNLYFKDPKYHKKFTCPVNFCAKQNDIIVACLDQREIPILDIRTNQQIDVLKRHMENNFVARFNPLNEKEFATAGEDKFCYVWDLRKLSIPLKQIKAQSKNFYNLTYTNQGYLLCQENDEYVQILDNRTQQYIQKIKLLPHSKCVGCVVVDEKIYLSINSINTQFIGILEYNLFNKI